MDVDGDGVRDLLVGEFGKGDFDGDRLPQSTFKKWASPPSRTESDRCDNAIRAVRNAIANSDKLKNRRTKVFVQGSYRNRVNVRVESDVDIGVLCDESFFDDYPAVCLQGRHAIRGEVYHVSDEQFGLLDELEWYPDFYQRIEISTDFGAAWMYIVKHQLCQDKRQIAGVWPFLETEG